MLEIQAHPCVGVGTNADRPEPAATCPAQEGSGVDVGTLTFNTPIGDGQWPRMTGHRQVPLAGQPVATARRIHHPTGTEQAVTSQGASDPATLGHYPTGLAMSADAHAQFAGMIQQDALEFGAPGMEAASSSMRIATECLEPPRTVPLDPMTGISRKTGRRHSCHNTKLFQQGLDAGMQTLSWTVGGGGTALDKGN
jgi:hypothetical protein